MEVPSIEELKRTGYRGKDLAGKSAWYRLNRAVSIRLTRLLLRTPVRANDVSWVMLALAVVAGALAARPGWASLAAAVACLYLSYLLDRVDGEVARLRAEESWTGAYLDWLYHRLAPTLFHLGLLYRVYEASPSGWMLALLSLAGVVLLLVKENTEVAYNLYPRIDLPPPPAEEAVSAPGAVPSYRDRSRGLLGAYFTADGAALVYAAVAVVEAIAGIDLVRWMVVLGFAASLVLLARGVVRLAGGGLEREIARIRRDRAP